MTNFKILSSTVLLLTFVLLGVHCQYAGHGQECDLNRTCRSDFTCVSGRCQCLYPRHQNYDYASDICISLVLGPCTANIDGAIVDIPCVANSECRNETGFPECVCVSGTRQNGRNCRAEFGQPCRVNSDCLNVDSFNDNPVICKNDVCDCGNLETYDEATGRCLGLVGAHCGTGYVCVQGAACERFDSFNGICRCTGTNEPTPDRRCSSFQCPRF